MYIKIGSDTKPLGLKVAGGFIVDTPILKIVNYQVQINPYVGTPEASFTKPPVNPTPLKPVVSVTVVYYRTYADFLNAETPVNFGQPPLPASELPTEPTLQSNYYGLVIEGEITLAAVYEALKLKIFENFKTISVVTE